MEIIDRFFQAPKTSFFLLGPRGTGKSTFVHQHFEDAIYIQELRPDRLLDQAFTPLESPAACPVRSFASIGACSGDDGCHFFSEHGV